MVVIPGLREGPEVFIVLGSGLAGMGLGLASSMCLPFRQVGGLPDPAVEGHGGMLSAGRLAGRPVLIQEGRLHAYEGHAPQTITRPLWMAAESGAHTAILSAAAGGISERMVPGSIMILSDHLDLSGRGSLTGRSLPSKRGSQPGRSLLLSKGSSQPGRSFPSGPSSLARRSSPGDLEERGRGRFFDLATPYDPELQELAAAQADQQKLPCERGTYAAVLGPSYETPAEIRWLASVGADAVGMSLVREVLTARALGMRVLAFCLITNRAAGLGQERLRHEDVLRAAESSRARLHGLVERVLGSLA